METDRKAMRDRHSRVLSILAAVLGSLAHPAAILAAESQLILVQYGGERLKADNRLNRKANVSAPRSSSTARKNRNSSAPKNSNAARKNRNVSAPRTSAAAPRRRTPR